MLSDYKPTDPNRDFYDLPLEARFSKYQALGHELYEKRQAALGPFSKKENAYPEKRLTPKKLTDELRENLFLLSKGK